MLSSVISQRWTLYGRILAGTLCVDQWNSISEGLHGCDDEKQQQQQQEEQISQKKTKTEQPIKTTATKQLNTNPLLPPPPPPPHPLFKNIQNKTTMTNRTVFDRHFEDDFALPTVQL